MNNPIEWILGFILICSSLGVILARQPVHASLFFLLTLLTLAGFYLLLSAQFIAVIQILIYAGAILVIFMFVIILFQDAHQQISQFKAQSATIFLFIVACAFVLALMFLGRLLFNLEPSHAQLPEGYGTVQSLGQALYVDFFFPFEAVILLFLVAVIGAVYIAKREVIQPKGPWIKETGSL
jgi:NADH-quinone oxidoreductase subunit J